MQLKIRLAAAALLCAAAPAFAQSDAALRSAFEGRTVVVRIDMPATSRGVDVYPLDAMPVNFRDVAERLKDYGTALRIGQPVIVTKVLIKKNSHVEFQLGGGGFGTAGDYTGSDVQAVRAAESKEEKALRDSVKRVTDRDLKRKLERELDALRSARERENARGEAEAQQANIARAATVRAKRAESGSRFNVRFRDGIPPEAATPDGIMRALAQYVDFGPAASVGAASGPPPSAGGMGPLRKGLLVEEVEAQFGPAATASESKEGSLLLVRRTYRRGGMQLVASFVNGVLIDFTMGPQR